MIILQIIMQSLLINTTDCLHLIQPIQALTLFYTPSFKLFSFLIPKQQ